MAERKADPHPSIENGYHIPIDEEKTGDFPHQRPVAVVVSDAHARYHVYKKDIPTHLSGAKYRSKPVKWLNNFGLKHIDRDEYAGDVPEYTVLLDPVEGGEYVYYDGKAIRPLPARPHEAHPGKMHAVLTLGDPPVGWVG